MSAWSETVWKEGASADTSQRYLPELVRFTLFRTTRLWLQSRGWMQIRDYKLLCPIERDGGACAMRASKRTRFYQYPQRKALLSAREACKAHYVIAGCIRSATREWDRRKGRCDHAFPIPFSIIARARSSAYRDSDVADRWPGTRGINERTGRGSHPGRVPSRVRAIPGDRSDRIEITLATLDNRSPSLRASRVSPVSGHSRSSQLPPYSRSRSRRAPGTLRPVACRWARSDKTRGRPCTTSPSTISLCPGWSCTASAPSHSARRAAVFAAMSCVGRRRHLQKIRYCGGLRNCVTTTTADAPRSRRPPPVPSRPGGESPAAVPSAVRRPQLPLSLFLVAITTASPRVAIPMLCLRDLHVCEHWCIFATLIARNKMTMRGECRRWVSQSAVTHRRRAFLSHVIHSAPSRTRGA